MNDLKKYYFIIEGSDEILEMKASSLEDLKLNYNRFIDGKFVFASLKKEDVKNKIDKMSTNKIPKLIKQFSQNLNKELEPVELEHLQCDFIKDHYLDYILNDFGGDALEIVKHKYVVYDNNNDSWFFAYEEDISSLYQESYKDSVDFSIEIFKFPSAKHVGYKIINEIKLIEK
jgi:hypothetical protein